MFNNMLKAACDANNLSSTEQFFLPQTCVWLALMALGERELGKQSEETESFFISRSASSWASGDIEMHTYVIDVASETPALL